MGVAADQPKGGAVNVIHVPLHKVGEGSFISFGSVSGQQINVRCHTGLPIGNRTRAKPNRKSAGKGSPGLDQPAEIRRDC
jgi:hypothetical protein